MSRVCEVCGKKTLSTFNVSHAKNKTKRKSYPNLRRVKAEVGGTVRKVRLCTKCLKKGTGEGKIEN